MDTPPTAAAKNAVRLIADRYGKSRVRLVKVAREGSRHELRELTVQVLCQGDFESSYRDGDNSKVLPTDTMKNTVYALAKREGLASIEAFGATLASHFLANNGQVAGVRIKITEDLWSRIDVDGNPHGSAFLRGGGEKRTTQVSATRDVQSIESGITGLTILKSSKSAFEGYPKDAFTTLKETSDRIFATSLRASWRYAGKAVDFDPAWSTVRRTILETFALHESRSVQHTLYAIAEAVLESCAAVEEIHLVMPNRHCLF
ncbi:MAG: urate oxidase, partial [Acidobacteriota bacterium]|nr:urate oxidase [Acidobacteriota bacterium]